MIGSIGALSTHVVSNEWSEQQWLCPAARPPSTLMGKGRNLPHAQYGRTMNPLILVVGSINTDFSACGAKLPSPGETIEANEFQIGLGGKGTNQAVAAARLG